MKDRHYYFKRAGMFALLFFLGITLSIALSGVPTISNFMSNHLIAEYVYASVMVLIWCIFAYYCVRYQIFQVKSFLRKLKEFRNRRGL